MDDLYAIRKAIMVAWNWGTEKVFKHAVKANQACYEFKMKRVYN